MLPLNATQSENRETPQPCEIRFQQIAAILARGIIRLLKKPDSSGNEPTVPENLTNSLPQPLELSPKPSLSVSYDVDG